MSEFLKISTPVIQKNNPVAPNKQVANPDLKLDISEALQIVKSSSAEHQSSNGNILAGENKSPSVLVDLLKNPSVTVNFLKNIMLLQEIIKLIPVKNTALTEELTQLFESLLISPEEIVGEMQAQEKASTIFKGELFDMLREILSEASSKGEGAELSSRITTFLKSLNSFVNKDDTLDSISNNLFSIASLIGKSDERCELLLKLSQSFKNATNESFPQLKKATLAVLANLEDSIFITPKLSKIISITIYNLSRFNPSEEFLEDSFSSLYALIQGQENKDKLLMLFGKYLQAPSKFVSETRIMDTLSKIISGEASKSDLSSISGEKIDNIIHSLLSSPCNFTPLLHYIIPVMSETGKSFAEFWIDPDAEEEKISPDIKEAIHMLIVFDIDSIGQFEAEIYSLDRRLSVSLLCPKGYDKIFGNAIEKLSPFIRERGFSIDKLDFGTLEKQRSLMEVFKTLPYKRTGIDVKI